MSPSEVDGRSLAARKFYSIVAGFLVAVFGLISSVQAERVYLDYSGVAWPAFAGKVAADFEAEIDMIVAADYAEFSYLSFTSSGAMLVSDTVIEFGDSSGGGFFGEAHLVDWDNKLTAQNNMIAANNAPGSAIDVFVSGFVGTGSPLTDSFAGFTTAVGATASHELGHGFGLRHFDTFGPSTVVGNPNPQADQHIMATGSTGLSLTERTEFDRIFSEHSRDKLAYLDPANKASRKRSELSPGALTHASIATAEPLTIGPADTLAETGRQVMVKVGSLAVAGETDFYAFPAIAGDKLYANIFSERLSDSEGILGIADPINSVLKLYDPSGLLVYTNNDIGYNFTGSAAAGIGDTADSDSLDGSFTKAELLALDEVITFGQDASSADSPYLFRTTDSIILDVPTGDFLTLGATGTWYIEVSAFSPETGDYELFVSLVPEPGSLSLVVLGSLTLLRRFRRRR